MHRYHRRANDTRTRMGDPVKQLKVQVTYEIKFDLVIILNSIINRLGAWAYIPTRNHMIRSNNS